MDLEKCQLHIINYFVKTKIYQDQANTNIEKNDQILFNIYIYRTYICDAGKVEISCVIRGDSQRKINVFCNHF